MLQNYYIDRALNKEIIEKVCKLVETLAITDFTEFGACNNEDDNVACFNFDGVAQERFYSWYEDLHNNKLRADYDPIILEHLAKFPSLVASRLTGPACWPAPASTK